MTEERKATIRADIRTVALIVAIMTLFLLAIQLGNWFIPHKEVHDGVVYQMQQGEAKALGVSPCYFQSTVIIPDRVNGRKVIAVNKTAFEKNLWIETVILPDSLQ